jgi:hypothetical protein
VVRKDSTVRLVEQRGHWCRVAFDDPTFGLREGYVRASYQRLRARGGFEDAISPTAPAQADRAWLELDAGRAWSSELGFNSFSNRPLFGEPLITAVHYPRWSGTAPGAAISGGVGLRRGLGLAGRFDTLSRSRQTDSVSISVPSPFFPQTPGGDFKHGPTIERRDRSIDLSVVYSVPSPDAVRVRFLGGPTYFLVTDHLIESVVYAQEASASVRANHVTMTSFVTPTASASTWGYHVGLDVSIFFQKHVGLGGSMRFSRGTAAMRDPLGDQTLEVEAGHPQLSGGVRIKF